MDGHQDGSGLEPRERGLVALSSALASGAESEIRGALEAARERCAAEEVEETILQSYLFLGYPAALEGFAIWREVAGAGPAGNAPGDWEAWTRRGEEVCRVVYGEQYGALRDNVRALHPDMDRWMITEGYGKVLGRPGLELRVRELCVAAILAVRGAAVQLYSHLRGALNAGAGPEAVDEALRVASGYATEEARRTAEATWARVRDRGS